MTGDWLQSATGAYCWWLPGDPVALWVQVSHLLASSRLGRGGKAFELGPKDLAERQALTASVSFELSSLSSQSSSYTRIRRSLFCLLPDVDFHVTHRRPSPRPLLIPTTMLRLSARCSRQLQSCSARASFSTCAASPSRTALAASRRPLALSQRRRYAVAAEDTDKGVVRRPNSRP